MLLKKTNLEVAKEEVKISELKSTSSKLKDEVKTLEKSMSDSTKTSVALEKNIDRDIKSISKTLQKVQSDVQKERDKIAKPMNLLREREIAVDKKERNLNTLIRRFKKYHKRVFPNREINI